MANRPFEMRLAQAAAAGPVAVGTPAGRHIAAFAVAGQAAVAPPVAAAGLRIVVGLAGTGSRMERLAAGFAAASMAVGKPVALAG